MRRGARSLDSTRPWSRVPRDLAGERPPSPVAPFLIAELVDIDASGNPIYDETFVDKQPDWTYDDTDSGQSPADRLTDKRAD